MVSLGDPCPSLAEVVACNTAPCIPIHCQVGEQLLHTLRSLTLDGRSAPGHDFLTAQKSAAVRIIKGHVQELES